MKVAYIRVSTVEQNEARQMEAMKGFGIDKYFIEKKSGKDADRPQLQASKEEAAVIQPEQQEQKKQGFFARLFSRDN